MQGQKFSEDLAFLAILAFIAYSTVAQKKQKNILY
jgi:hypothetical protein